MNTVNDAVLDGIDVRSGSITDIPKNRLRARVAPYTTQRRSIIFAVVRNFLQHIARTSYKSSS